jgi:drug/metabolite transporter (DMT)-like permease
MSNRVVIGMAFATAAAVLWAVTHASTLLLPAGFPTTEVVWGRYGFQLVLLLLFVTPVRGAALVRTRRPGLQLLRGSTMLVMPAAFTVAVGRMNVADAWAALWLAPLAGMLLARMLGRERASAATWIVAIVATIGAILAHAPHARVSPSGLLAVAIAAAAFGAFLLLTRALRDEAATTGLFWTAAAVFVPTSLLVARAWQPLTGRALVALGAMGALWLLVLAAIDEALRRAPLAVIAPFLLTEIVWERLLLGAPWTGATAAGAVAVIGCAAWAVRAARFLPKPAGAPI